MPNLASSFYLVASKRASLRGLITHVFGSHAQQQKKEEVANRTKHKNKTKQKESAGIGR